MLDWYPPIQVFLRRALGIEEVSMKLRSLWPAVASTMTSIQGKGKLSFGQAQLTSVKSMQSCNFPFAFLRKTTLANQSG